MDIRDPEYNFEQTENKTIDESTVTASVQQLKETGEIEYMLDVYEYAPYDRNPLWGKLMLLLIILLSALAFWLDGWGSVTMVIAFGVLGYVYLKTHKATDSQTLVRAGIAKYGLLFGGKMYSYEQMTGYYFLFFPGYITMNFQIQGKLSSIITLYLRSNEDLETIRSYMTEKVKEEFEMKENPVQKLIRLLQL